MMILIIRNNIQIKFMFTGIKIIYQSEFGSILQ